MKNTKTAEFLLVFFFCIRSKGVCLERQKEIVRQYYTVRVGGPRILLYMGKKTIVSFSGLNQKPIIPGKKTILSSSIHARVYSILVMDL